MSHCLLWSCSSFLSGMIKHMPTPQLRAIYSACIPSVRLSCWGSALCSPQHILFVQSPLSPAGATGERGFL